MRSRKRKAMSDRIASLPIPKTLKAVRPLHISGDCTGLDSGMLSLQSLGLGSRSVPGFASDIEAYVRMYLRANFKHSHVFSDMMGRDNLALDQKLKSKNMHPDIYTAGWPCQPFSVAGRQQGQNDPRGLVGLAVADTIMTIKPKTFVLENVPGVFTNPKFKPLLDLMLHSIATLKDAIATSCKLHPFLWVYASGASPVICQCLKVYRYVNRFLGLARRAHVLAYVSLRFYSRRVTERPCIGSASRFWIALAMGCRRAEDESTSWGNG